MYIQKSNDFNIESLYKNKIQYQEKRIMRRSNVKCSLKRRNSTKRERRNKVKDFKRKIVRVKSLTTCKQDS